MDSSKDDNIEELIIRALQEEISRFEEGRLRAWILESDENARRFEEMQELWEATGSVAPRWHEEPPDFDAIMDAAEEAEAVRRAREADGEIRLPEPSKPLRRTVASDRSRVRRWAKTSWIQLAAAAATFFAIGLGVAHWMGGDVGEGGMLSNSEIVTGAGEMTMVTLSDGTSIRLGPESRLRLAEGSDQREAWLHGRAFFGVQSDEARPFTVNTRYGNAIVLGTRFEIRTEEEEFRVLVVEGEVSVEAGGSQVHVSQGEMSRSVGGGSPSTEKVSDVYEHLDWLGNAIVFQDTPLDGVVRELERRYEVDILVTDPVLRELSVTAAFTGQPIGEVMFVLCQILGAECNVDGERVLMQR